VGALGGAVALALGRTLLSLDGMAWGRRVDEVMVREVQTLPASATIAEAARRMRDYNVGVLPIVDGDRIRAVVTDRDLVVRGLATGLDPASARAVDCATREPIAARPDWSVDRALSTMAENQVGRLPVVDEEGRVIGIVTLSSLALRSSDPEETLDAARHVSLRSSKASWIPRGGRRGPLRSLVRFVRSPAGGQALQVEFRGGAGVGLEDASHVGEGVARVFRFDRGDAV
jgi:CBS domain-containing protein